MLFDGRKYQTMKKAILFAASVLLMTPAVQASENMLVTIYQPLFLNDHDPPVACAVPFVTGGPYPEVFVEAITQPHHPQGNSPRMDGEADVNAASVAGISLKCEIGGEVRILIFDFKNADPKLVDKDLIKALLDCLDKSKKKNSGYRSRIL